MVGCFREKLPSINLIGHERFQDEFIQLIMNKINLGNDTSMKQEDYKEMFKVSDIGNPVKVFIL